MIEQPGRKKRGSFQNQGFFNGLSGGGPHGPPPLFRHPAQPGFLANQYSALPVVRGKGSTSRMFCMPVRYITSRSKPRPKPACGVVP